MIWVFPDNCGIHKQDLQIISGFKGSLKNSRLEKSPPPELRMRHYSLVDFEKFLMSSANVPAVPTYLVVKRKEGDFVKVSHFFSKSLPPVALDQPSRI